MAILTNPFLATGNPDLENNATLYAPGELGQQYVRGDFMWTQVQVDSTATAAMGRAPTANDIMYWRNKQTKIVTNVLALAMNVGVANSYQNHVAGVLRNSATPGNYVWLLQRGLQVPISSRGAGLTAGQSVQADTANIGSIVGLATGTANTAQKLGIVFSPTVAQVTIVDLNVTDWGLD